jgi:hypothetical protein
MSLPYGSLSSLVFARYTQALLQRIFDPLFVMPESDIDIKIKAELQQIARVVSEARRNIRKLSLTFTPLPVTDGLSLIRSSSLAHWGVW